MRRVPEEIWKIKWSYEGNVFVLLREIDCKVSVKAVPHSNLKECSQGGLYSSEMILSLLDKVQSPDALLVLVNLAKKYEIERYPLTQKLIDNTDHEISEGIHKKA